MSTIQELTLAVRAWTTRERNREAERRRRSAAPPGHLLVFDVETTTDAAQALTFGSWRFYRAVDQTLVLLDEGLFYDDELPDTDPEGFATIRHYCDTHAADLDRRRPAPLRLVTRSEFVDKVFHKCAYKMRAAVVGFNLAFDLSRIAIDVGEARGHNRGGFSFILHPPKKADYRENRHRPRITIVHLDAHRQRIEFTKTLNPDPEDLIPPDSETGQPDPRYLWKGRFIDLHTLAYALTGESHSLASACEALDAAHTKSTTDQHGQITPDYIDYNRQDVRATAALYQALAAELELHPIDLAAEHAKSAASLGKSYLEAMGLRTVLERQPDFPPDVLGWAMSAYYGGRSECHIRRTPVPVAYCDFTSMYPTVDILMGLWNHLTADCIDPIDATAEITELLDTITLDDCFDPNLWPQLVGIVQIRPNGDILPARANYSGTTWTTGLNPITTDETLWYTIADCITSTLLAGRPPEVLRAIRFQPTGRAKGLRPVRLRGAVLVDPRNDDLFKTVVEQRQYRRRANGGADDALTTFLKTLVNSGAYGIHSQFNTSRLPAGETALVTVHGRFDEPFTKRVRNPEDPGPWTFPPFAACITGGARLMLAMLERCVTDLGGTYAFCDTDSMAIVTTTQRKLIECPGGPLRRRDGSEAIRALSHTDVQAIRQRFANLNPYDPTAVSDTILKLEATGTCLAVSAKRYCIYRTTNGKPQLLKRSEHGLGHLLNPTDPDNPDRDWISQHWLAAAEGIQLNDDWLDRPTITKTTVSSPELLRAFAPHNDGIPYRQRIKPFNFLVVAPNAKPPAGIDPSAFRLIAPWNSDPTTWASLAWTNLHGPTEGPYRISTNWSDPGCCCIDSYRDHLRKYKTRPENKALGADGEPCARLTAGELGRLPLTPSKVTHVGKEAPRLLDPVGSTVRGRPLLLDFGMGPATAHWESLAWRIRTVGLARTAALLRVSERQIRRYLSGETQPRDHQLAALSEAVRRAEQLVGGATPGRDRPAFRSHVCAECGATPIRPRAKYCGPTCKKRGYRRRSRLRAASSSSATSDAR